MKLREELERTQATLGKSQLHQEKIQNTCDKAQSDVEHLQERMEKATNEIRRVWMMSMMSNIVSGLTKIFFL